MLSIRLSTPAARCALALGLITSIGSARADVPPPLSLQESVALASTRASHAETSSGTVQAALQMAVAAGQLPDPILKFGLNNVPANGTDRFSLGRDFMTMRSIGLMQEFTRGSKRRARAERFEAEASVAEAQRVTALAAVQRSAATAWIDHWYAGAAFRVIEQQRTAAELQLRAAEAAYRGGRGTRSDVLQAQLVIQKLDDQQDVSRAAIGSAQAALERWVGPAASRPPGNMPELLISDRIANLTRMAATDAPEIVAANRQIAMAEADIRATTEAGKPDASVELMYSQRGSAYSNMVSLNVSIPLPWDRGNRQDREVAAKLAAARAARAQAEVVTRNVLAMIRAKQSELDASKVRLQRYQQRVIPLSRAQAEAALTAYRGNQGTLTMVTEANRRVLDSELERLSLEAATARLWADLHFLMPLPAAESQSMVGEQ